LLKSHALFDYINGKYSPPKLDNPRPIYQALPCELFDRKV
jgi:hypothetical protein